MGCSKSEIEHVVSKKKKNSTNHRTALSKELSTLQPAFKKKLQTVQPNVGSGKKNPATFCYVVRNFYWIEHITSP